jgi:AP-3 complex subunit mu
MPIDGVIILENGRPIIQSGFRSSSPAYPLLHIDTFNDALAKTSNPEDIDPVLYSSQFDISDGSSACCHMECGGLRFLCPISGDGPCCFTTSPFYR